MGIRGQNQCYLAILARQPSAFDRPIGRAGSDRSSYVNADLLPVAGQHLAAGFGQLRTILLQACENDEIALVHELPAITRDIARASLLLVWRAAALLLGNGAGRN